MAGSISEVRSYGPSADGGTGDTSAGPPNDPSAGARADRAAADARYQAFVSSGSGGDPCWQFAGPDHDFDSCAREEIHDPVLFVKEGNDADAVEPRDIRQGLLGDCYLMGPLAALASTPDGRATLRGLVVENKNEKGQVVSYTVTLHEPERHMFGKTTFHEVPITVDGPYVVGHAEPRMMGSQNEVWPLVVEKAFAQYSGGYNKISRGGDAADVMTLLTGQQATSVSLGGANRWFGGYSEDRLRDDLASGKIVVLSTKAGIGGSTGPDATPEQRQVNLTAHGLVAHHNYFVKGTEQHDGKTFLLLGNPWGHRDPAPVPFDELATWFSGVSIGSLH